MSQLISATVADGVGHLTLDRPRALNALNFEMVLALTDVLDAWREDSEVGVVVLDGEGDRGFCAGGDLRELHAFATAGDLEPAHDFFRAEYRLDAEIARYPKPVVAIMDGITMGGGVGLTGHASIRIVTERSRVAMPETRIGFTPDVGGTWLLANAPGELGVHLALNSRTMDASDALHAGFADAYVPSERVPHLLQALAERADPGTPSEIVMLFDETPGPSALALARDWVDACYSAPTVHEIIGRLRAFAGGARDASLPRHPLDPGAPAYAAAAADELETLSPTALTVTLEAVRRARTLPRLEDAIEQEFRAVTWFIEQHDLHEGIRAQVIDKDRSPRWNPPALDDVPPGLASRVLDDTRFAPVFPPSVE
ncbi:enoyl-CoA hydratase/isomerase family protein [Agromyces aerolatus]|uniref:enoyl-CoA hydratase/isomerase family protein n=1 Tax=Agromyces sp. LY-1074 TaxID=3074080 RepID=UPI0028653837|nr:MULTISPECIES: enoyl-CoA hydratase/isomerase family protein [unclassified Agromyces]MDR5701533.1 enoyl-CoA hydratase/isomerase family protein [Agromyces sp. LY-1074]MDR5707860.1 enoyl-CoA hydratase/isomerase family protein [Agromyces sp. LY-1358]